MEFDENFGLGCLKAPYDERDYQFANLVASVDRQTYPQEYIPDLSGIKHFDQGSSSMCCACAVAMSRYIFEMTDSGNKNLFSPKYIYGNRCDSSIVDGVYEGEGMYLKDAMKQLIKAGDCYYNTLPGFGSYTNCNKAYERIKEAANTEAKPFRVSSYYATNSNKQIMKAIMTTGAVLASYLVTSGWYDVQKDGIIGTSGSIEGAHAILLVGWKMINNELHWIVFNSWGDDWGDNGCGYIPATENPLEAYCILDEVQEIQIKS